jgi:DNA-binding transcriptional ArsR family regulator
MLRPPPETPESSVDPIFKALGNALRRQILDRLREQPLTTGALATSFPGSRFALMQHLEVLVEAGLVVARKRGRERWNFLNAAPLQAMYERWVSPYEAAWAGGLSQLKNALEKNQTTGDGVMTEQKIEKESCAIAEVELEIEIAAPLERVWQSLTNETTKWWRQDFLVGAAQGFFIEPRVGGRMFEDWGNDAGVLWGTVIVFAPPKALELLMHLTPPFGGPALSMLRLALEATPTGTKLALSDAIFGRVKADTRNNLSEGWRLLFAEGLKPYVETTA